MRHELISESLFLGLFWLLCQWDSMPFSVQHVGAFCSVCVLPSVSKSLFLTQFAGGTAAVHLAVLTKLWCSAGKDPGRSILYLQTFNSSHTQTLLDNSLELTLRLPVPSFLSSGNRVN